MNSVFSAFKSGKNENKTKLTTSGSGCNSNNGVGNGSKKPPATQDPTSYENLRHIREITYCSKMSSNFIVGDDESTSIPSPAAAALQTYSIQTKTPTTPVQSPLSEKNILDLDFDEQEQQQHDVVDSCTAALPPSGKTFCHEPNSEPNLLMVNNNNGSAASDSGSDSEHNFMSNIKARSEQVIGGNNRLLRPRLSLSSASGSTGFMNGGGGFNKSMPSVHGRSNGAISSNTGCNGTGNNGAPTRTRLSTHQRNLSLDFR